MKKIIIRQVESQLIANIDSITPRLLTEDKEDIIAIFDVADCFIHC